MQVTQADESSCKRVGVEEHLIKFKSSPNFKNMKKYIRSRSETTSLGSPIPAALGAPEPPPPPNLGEKGHLLRKDWHTSEVQPPLPLDPPPPDYVPNLKVKQEVVDTEYEGNRLSPTLENQKDGNTEQTNDRSNEICRDFIRGTCKREGTCKYAHKHDLSQLEGVYTFCRKFQNSVCTFTHCKYVHATVFEEQHFYRTGVLPDHALHHRTNNNILQPPPPPPPPEEPPAVPPLNIDFSNPPPPFRNEIEPPMINISAHPVDATCYMRDMHNQMPTQSLSQSISPLKREWSNLNTFTAPPSDLAYNEQLSKKCKHCDVVEFRLDHNKDKLKKGLQSKEQLSKNIVSLEKQSEKLRNLISELLRPTISSSTYRQINDLKYKNLMEQLNSFLSANNRSSTLGEDK